MKTMKTWQNFAGNSGTATTTWHYDPYRGWLTNKVHADGKGPVYTYSNAGRLKSRAWARGVTTWYTNNVAGDLVTINYSDATPDVTYTYDRRGRQATIAAGGLTTTLAYNNASHLLSETYAGGALNGLAVTNAYDAYLRRSAVALKTQPATLTQFGYDLAGRLLGATNGSYRAAYTYLANAPLVSQITLRSNSVTRMTTTKSYDFLNRLTDIQSSTGGAPVAHSAYAYNAANQRTAVTNADNARWVYTYDDLGQVISGKKYWSDGTPVAGQQFEYGFDDIGNRKNTKVGGDQNGANLRPANYTNNTLNQITGRGVPGYADVMGLALLTNTVTVNGQSTYRKGEYFRKELTVNNSSAPVWTNLSVAAPGETTVAGNVLVARTPQTFTHDFDGNLTSDGLWTNTWNAENRLLKTESLASVAAAARAREEWTYLPDGRWIQRIVSTNNGAAYYPAYTNRYVWDGQVLLAILDHTNGLVMSFMRGLDLSGSLQGAGGVGGVLAVSFKTNGTHFCAYDGNGNVAALVSAANGSASARYEYGPFGETIRMTGPMAKLNPIRFSTQYADDVTGNVKYLYRDYNPSTGRWLNRDPIEERGGVNLYGFVGNKPVGGFDPLGQTSYFDLMMMEGKLCCEKSVKYNLDAKHESATYVPPSGTTSQGFVTTGSAYVSNPSWFIAVSTPSYASWWSCCHHADYMPQDGPLPSSGTQFDCPCSDSRGGYVCIWRVRLHYLSCEGGRWKIQMAEIGGSYIYSYTPKKEVWFRTKGNPETQVCP